MQKTFTFFIDATGNGKCDNRATVTIELRKNDTVFAASGTVYDGPRGRGSIWCGQCLDEIADKIDTMTPDDAAQFIKIWRLWKLYHLNDMHAGTPAQEFYLQKIGLRGADKYAQACDALRAVNLYNDNGCEYGRAWYFQEIPAADMAIIRELIGGGNDSDE